MPANNRRARLGRNPPLNRERPDCQRRSPSTDRLRYRRGGCWEGTRQRARSSAQDRRRRRIAPPTAAEDQNALRPLPAAGPSSALRCRSSYRTGPGTCLRPLSRSRALPGPESSYRWRSPRSAAGSASPRCFARSAPHSYFLRKERSKSPVQGTMPGRARRESVHSASLREQLVLEAPAGSDSGRLRHLRACGPLPPGDWDSRAALGHCSVGARGVGGETHCPGAYWCLRREGTGGRVAQLAPRAGSRQRGRQPRLSHAGKRSTGAAGSRAGGGGGWRGKRVPRGGAGARGRCEARVVGQSRAAAIMLRRLTGEQIRDWFTIGKAVTAVEFLGEEAQPGALRGPPYRPPSPPAAREPLTAAGWVRVLWSWSARRCSSRPGCRAVCEGAGWPACSRGCDRGPGCAGRFARVWVTHSGSAALPGLGGVWLLDSSLTPSSVVFVAVVQVWVGAGLWV